MENKKKKKTSGKPNFFFKVKRWLRSQLLQVSLYAGIYCESYTVKSIYPTHKVES